MIVPYKLLKGEDAYAFMVERTYERDRHQDKC